MKKRVLFFLFAMMFLASTLVGCSEKAASEPGPYEGTWIGLSAEAFGVQMAVEDAFNGAFEFTVKPGGKLTFTVGDKSGSGKWSVKDSTFTMTLQGETMEGVVGNNCITFDNMLGMGVKVIFAKEGTDAMEPSNYWPEEEKAMLGLWASDTVEELLGDGPEEISDAAGDGLLLEFKKDHTVAVTYLGEVLGAFPWSYALGYCIIESDDPSLYVTMLGDGTFEVNYSDADNYLTYHMSKAASAAAAAKPAQQTAAQPSVPVQTAELTDVQKRWNGWWYGGMEFDNCTGEFASLDDYVFSLAMYVDLDASGKGTLQLYEVQGLVTQDYQNNCFAQAVCYGDDMYLKADSGTCFGGDIYTNDWRFVFNRKFTDRLEMGSSQTSDNGDELEYFFYLKTWGADWSEDEKNLTRRIMGFEEHMDALKNGETDIFGNKGAMTSTASAAATAPAAGDTAAKPSGGEKSALLGSDPEKLDINDKGVVYVYYPKGQFTYNPAYGKIKSTSGSVGILFDPMLGSTNFEELKASYEKKNSGMSDYSLKEITVNGYKALVMTYSDWLGATMRVDVDYGGKHGGYYGLSFAVSGNSLKECDTELVWAIIQSFELVK